MTMNLPWGNEVDPGQRASGQRAPGQQIIM